MFDSDKTGLIDLKEFVGLSNKQGEICLPGVLERIRFHRQGRVRKIVKATNMCDRKVDYKQCDTDGDGMISFVSRKSCAFLASGLGGL